MRLGERLQAEERAIVQWRWPMCVGELRRRHVLHQYLYDALPHLRQRQRDLHQPRHRSGRRYL